MKYINSHFPFLIAAAISVLAVNSYSEGITVTQSIDRIEAAYEDTIQMEIRLNWNGSPHAYLIEGLIRPELDRLKVTRSTSSVSSKGRGADEQTTKIYTFQLVPTISGKGKISPIEINYVTYPDSISGSISTDPLEIAIASPVARKKSANNKNSFLTTGIIALVISVLILIGTFVFMKRKRAAVDDYSKSPMEVFSDALAALKGECGSDYKRFQTGFYKLLTAFISSQHKIIGKGLSCDEIITAMKESDMPATHCDKFSEWLRRAEREKYSPSGAPPGEVMRVESEIQKFLKMIK